MTLSEQIAALHLPPMTEAELAHYCGLSMTQWEKRKDTIVSDDRAFCEQARALEILCPLWAAVVEPYPSDVMVNKARQRKKK